ncbi:MAG: response regulator [Gemmatimonadales bacterium]|nr:response regulator [Gemmatimonadales bacterium]
MDPQAKILLADDDHDILESVRLRLRANNYEVLTASDGIEATRLAKTAHPDLVLLDINMPGGNGHVVAQRIKSDPATISTPIIFLTASTSTVDYEAAREAGVEKFIIKPFAPEELLLAMEELLERGRLQSIS